MVQISSTMQKDLHENQLLIDTLDTSFKVNKTSDQWSEWRWSWLQHIGSWEKHPAIWYSCGHCLVFKKANQSQHSMDCNFFKSHIAESNLDLSAGWDFKLFVLLLQAAPEAFSWCGSTHCPAVGQKSSDCASAVRGLLDLQGCLGTCFISVSPESQYPESHC